MDQRICDQLPLTPIRSYPVREAVQKRSAVISKATGYGSDQGAISPFKQLSSIPRKSSPLLRWRGGAISMFHPPKGPWICDGALGLIAAGMDRIGRNFVEFGKSRKRIWVFSPIVRSARAIASTEQRRHQMMRYSDLHGKPLYIRRQHLPIVRFSG
jgi:hypothetical protein